MVFPFSLMHLTCSVVYLEIMMNSTIRAYVDTCVFGGAFDEEFAVSTSQFFTEIRLGRLNLITSSVVTDEILLAPLQVRELYSSLRDYITIVDPDENAFILQRAYLAANIVSSKWEEDALHVAIATVTGCDLIVSWNFKHLVNFRRIKAYARINIENGYQPIDIYTPREALYYDKENI